MKKFLLLCFSFVFVLSAWAQERVVSGKVTSGEDASTLPGVNVVLKGTTNGTVTDADGNYKLNVPAAGGSLLFSFIGLSTTEISIGDRSIIDVALGLDVTQLSEIVVTGTGVATDRRKLAISVESVKSTDLPAAPTASIDQALVGKIAGAQIQSVSGTPGAQVQILLRGVNTLQRGTTPMILVDGVQMVNTTLNSLDLSAVERVEVVQGAAAATIYGAQGANGVIQIFTKRGKKGKVAVDISSSIAQNEFLNVGGVRKANLHAFATDANGNVVGPSGDPLVQSPDDLTYSESIIYNALDPTLKLDKPYVGNVKYNDHFKQFFTSAQTINNSVRISGAGDNVDYAISVSNNRQESNIKNGGYYDRTNFVTNVGIELVKGLKLRSITQLIQTDNTTNSYIYGVFNTRPFSDFDKKDNDGNYGANYGSAAGVNGYNPNYYNQYTDRDNKSTDVIQNFNLKYAFPKFVELETTYGLNFNRTENIFSIGNQTLNKGNQATQYYWAGQVDSDAGEIDNDSRKATFQNSLTKATATFDFDKDFGMSIPLKSVTQVAFDYRNQNENYYQTYAQGLPTYTPFTPQQANAFRVYGAATTPFVTYGYLVNQRLDYGDIGGVSAGFRSDYSSAFGQGSKPFTFPRGDAYLRFSGFEFWDNSAISKVFLEFKVRAAYGKAGIQPFAFDRYVTLNTRVMGGQSGFVLPTTSSNPNLNVEVSTETEFGTDMTFNVLDNTSWLNNITLSGTYWDRSSDGVIYGVDAAPSTGIGAVKTNAFGLASKGIQFQLTTNVYHSGNLQWNFTTNFGKQTSEIKSVFGGGEVVLTSAAGSTGYVLAPGLKIGQLFGYNGLHSVNEVNTETGQPYIAAADQAAYEVASNGWVVKTATKQPYFSSTPQKFGDPNPKFNMSFINSFNYKGWLDFGFQIDMVNGNHLYNQTKEWMYRDGIHSDYEKQFSVAGETGAWTAFYRGVYAQISRNGTKNYFYEDASFVRLRNVNVAVDFTKLAKIAHFTKLQLVLTGRNLLTSTKYTGMDPELSSGELNSAWDRGTDHNSMPNLKSYQVGVNIGF